MPQLTLGSHIMRWHCRKIPVVHTPHLVVQYCWMVARSTWPTDEPWPHGEVLRLPAEGRMPPFAPGLNSGRGTEPGGGMEAPTGEARDVVGGRVALAPAIAREL